MRGGMAKAHARISCLVDKNRQPCSSCRQSAENVLAHRLLSAEALIAGPPPDHRRAGFRGRKSDRGNPDPIHRIGPGRTSGVQEQAILLPRIASIPRLLQARSIPARAAALARHMPALSEYP